MANSKNPVRVHLRRLVFVHIGAAVLCLLTAAWMYLESNVRGEPQRFIDLFLYVIPIWYPWALFSLVVLWVVEHERGPFILRSLGHFFLAVLMAYIHTGIRLAFHPLPNPEGEGAADAPTWFEQVLTSGTMEAPIHLFLYGVMLSVAHTICYKHRLRERELATSQLEAQLASAQVQALRMQLNPHFLFNAMNTISMLVRDLKREDAVKTIAGLSDLLRYVLDDSANQEIPLRQELDFIERYLAIEQIRFQDRLNVVCVAAPNTHHALVPNLVLQPIVENAIRHGIARSRAATTVSVSANTDGEFLVIRVLDDGPGFTSIPLELDDTGVGIANTQKRLNQLYGDKSTCEFENVSPNGASVTITIPFHTTSAVDGDTDG